MEESEEGTPWIVITMVVTAILAATTLLCPSMGEVLRTLVVGY